MRVYLLKFRKLCVADAKASDNGSQPFLRPVGNDQRSSGMAGYPVMPLGAFDCALFPYLRKLIYLFYYFKGFSYDGRTLVEDGEVFTHVPQVAGNEGFELEAEIGKGLLQLGFVLWLDFLFLAFG